MVHDITNNKKLQAAHHKWLRRILGTTWKQRISNEEVRQRTGKGKIEEIPRRTRLRWLGHVHRIENNRFARQAIKWAPKWGQKKEADPERTGELTLKTTWMWFGNVVGRSWANFWRQDDMAKQCCPMCWRHYAHKAYVMASVRCTTISNLLMVGQQVATPRGVSLSRFCDFYSPFLKLCSCFIIQRSGRISGPIRTLDDSQDVHLYKHVLSRGYGIFKLTPVATSKILLNVCGLRRFSAGIAQH